MKENYEYIITGTVAFSLGAGVTSIIITAVIMGIYMYNFENKRSKTWWKWLKEGVQKKRTTQENPNSPTIAHTNHDKDKRQLLINMFIEPAGAGDPPVYIVDGLKKDQENQRIQEDNKILVLEKAQQKDESA